MLLDSVLLCVLVCVDCLPSLCSLSLDKTGETELIIRVRRAGGI